MLSDWPTYFDSKTGTKSFYEVDYKLLAHKCGLSFQHILLLSPMGLIPTRHPSFMFELKIVFDKILDIIKEGLSKEQPCQNNKKVSKFIDNILMHIHIEKFYLRAVSEEEEDLEVSPSFCFVIQRLVRLVKDIHLLCVYAEKKESQEFLELRKLLREIIRSVRKRCVEFIKAYSAENTNSVKEMLVAQFLQLIKFLINFTKYKDHKAYVNVSTGGASSSSQSAPDIWSITDCSVRQAVQGASSILLDTRRSSELVPSLMAFQTKRSSVSTVQDLCSLNDILVRKKSFMTDDSLSQEQMSSRKSIVSPFGFTNFPKGTRRKTAGNQDRPGTRILDKDDEKPGEMHAQTYRQGTGSPGKKALARAHSLSVTNSRNEKNEVFIALETRRGEEEELDRVIEEDSEDMSPKRRRNGELEPINFPEQELGDILSQLNEQEEPTNFQEQTNKLNLIKWEERESMTFNECEEEPIRHYDNKEGALENIIIQEDEDNKQEDEITEESSPRKKLQRSESIPVRSYQKKRSIYDFGMDLDIEEPSNIQIDSKKSLETERIEEGPRGRLMTKMLERLKESENPRIDEIKTRVCLDSEEEASPKKIILQDNKLHLQSLSPRKKQSIFAQVQKENSPKSPLKSPEKISSIRNLPELKRLKTVMTLVTRLQEVDTPKLRDIKKRLNIVDEDSNSPRKSGRLQPAPSPSPYKRKRCASVDATPRKWEPKTRPKVEATPREQKKEKEDYVYKPKPHHMRRKNFLENLFGKQTKEKVEQCFDEAHRLQGYKNTIKDESEGDFAKSAEIGLTRLTGVPFMVSESYNFFTALRGARKEEAQNQGISQTRGLELWEVVRNAIRMKRLLQKVGYDKTRAFPPVIHNDRKLLVCLEKDLEKNIGSFKYRNIGLDLIECVGPLKKVKQASYKKHSKQGYFLPEDRECYELKDLEVSLMLARLTYNRGNRWSRVLSFRSKDNGSRESRSKDNSRDVSFSRDASYERSGSAYSCTKRPGLFRSLFRTNSHSRSPGDTNGILSPSNRSKSDSREFSPGIGSATSKPSLFKSLFKLNPVADTNPPSPGTIRSRSSSKDSNQGRDTVKENNDSIGYSSNNGSITSCPKKPSLFKSIFKSTLDTKEEEEEVVVQKRRFVFKGEPLNTELGKFKSILPHD